MAWNTDGTKQKILDAAILEFVKYGLDGTTIEKIAKKAGVNKERIYNYFGGKRELFDLVLQNELIKVSQDVPIKSLSPEDICEYAGRAYDYHCSHPEFIRLLLWEGLIYEGTTVPDEENRKKKYQYKIQAIIDRQQDGQIMNTIDAGHLAFIILAVANSWFMLPQVARMFIPIEDLNNHEKRRAVIVESVRQLIAKH